MKITIEEKEDHLKLLIRPKKIGSFVLMVLFFLTISSILVPINMLYRFGLNENTMIGLFLFILIGMYFVRLLFWNTRGKEIVEINTKEVKQILDYGIFKDTTVLENHNLILQINENNIAQQQDVVLDDKDFIKPSSNQLTIANNQNEKIYINGKLDFAMVQKLKSRLNCS